MQIIRFFIFECEGEHLDTVKLLIENGADVKKRDKFEQTAFVLGNNINFVYE